MLRRPKATDTEEDLLAFQDKFLTTGEKPCASIKTDHEKSERKVQVGSKRSQDGQTGSIGDSSGYQRDVVNLQMEGQVYKPPAKRSKFKERRARAKEVDASSVPDHHEFMERQDKHITKILSEIREHDTTTSRGFTMTSSTYTRGGFPVAQKLDSTSVTMDTGHPQSSSAAPQTKRIKNKKSLFAQQFEEHDLNYFGFDNTAEKAGQLRSGGGEKGQHSQKDFVCSIRMGSPVSEGLQGRLDKGLYAEKSTVMDGGGAQMMLKERLSSSSLISGEGLTSMDVSSEAAKNEVTMIHQENVDRLLSLPEEEVLKEQQRVQQSLDPGLVSFIKSRQQRQLKDRHKVTDSSSLSNQNPQTQSATGPPSIQGKVPLLSGSEPTGQSHDDEETVCVDSNSSHPEVVVDTPTSWLHMDVVEKEKMEWMTDVDVNGDMGTAPTRYGSNEVRFSLDGLVIPRNIVLPAHLGLHHHGNEPHAAGYTLDELLSLCRSTVLQQRTFSLQVLTRIIQRAKLNEFAGIVDGSVLEDLFASGVPLLLRYALDESVGSVMFAAVSCLHALLVIEEQVEERVLEEYTFCHLGCIIPSLRSPDKSHDRKAKEEQESETDAEILRRDVVQGYIEMKVLHRVRYILEMCSPPSPLPTHLLEIVTRVARHSLAAATQVVNCPRLMGVIFGQFLPLDWTVEEQEEGVASGKPYLVALKLVQVLCSSSANLSAQLMSRHPLMSVLTRYSIPLPSELNLPREHAYRLSMTALLTWGVLLRYGLGSEAFRDTYPVVLKQLHCLSTAAGSPNWGDAMETKRVGALFGLVNSAIHVAAVTVDQLKIVGTTDTHPPPAIEWSHAQGMHAPLLSCLGVLVQEVSTETVQMHKMVCTGSLLHCLASYYSRVPSKFLNSSLDLLQQLESLFKGPLSALIQSSLFTQAVHTLRGTSTLATPTNQSTAVSPPPASLPTHLTLPRPPKPALYNRSTMQSSDYSDLVQPRILCFTAANMVWGYVRLCRTALLANKSMTDKVMTFLRNTEYQEYLENVVRTVGSKVSVCELGELSLVYETIKLLCSWIELSDTIPEGCGQLTFDLTYKLLKLLPPGMECMAWDLLSTVALHPRLISAPSSLLLEKEVTSLSLKDSPQPITLESKVSVTMTTSQLLTKSLSEVPSILSEYQLTLQNGGLCTPQKIQISKSMVHGYPLQTPSLLLPPCHAHILPEDWVLLPIVQVYNRAVSGQRTTDQAGQSDRDVTMVTRSLQLLLLLEHLHPRVLKELPTSAKLSRLMCVYLIDSDIFLEKIVHCCLASLLSLYCREDCQATLDFTAPVPGLTSFVDLYSTLLDQYTAVSYSDPLFACYVLLPLQQRFEGHLKKLVWGEHPAVIRFLSIPLTQVPVSLNYFLQPTETNIAILEMYLSALVAGTVRPTWSPVFYLMAVHHTHSFIFESQESNTHQLKRKFLLRIVRLDSEDTKRHLLLYGGVDPDTPPGFRLNKELCDRQRTIIISLLGTDVAANLISLFTL